MVAAGGAVAATHRGALARPLPVPVGRRDGFLRVSSRRTHSPSRECLEAALAGLDCAVMEAGPPRWSPPPCATGAAVPNRAGSHRPRRRVVRRHPKGPGRSMDVVRRPVLLCVRRGPCRPPVVIDHERRLMLSRTPGRMRKLLRNVSGMGCPPLRRLRRVVPGRHRVPLRRPGMTSPRPCTRVISTSRYLPRRPAAATPVRVT
jgi:hypothetical protein